MNETIIDLRAIVTRSSAEFYQVQMSASSQGGIITILMEDDSLTVMAGTVFGEFSHKWPWSGGDPKPFLISMQRDYALRRLAREPLIVPDMERNAAIIRRAVCAARRARQLDQQQARSAWCELLAICKDPACADNPPLLAERIASGDKHRVFQDVTQLPTVTKFAPNALRFWSEIWLPFTKALNQELAA